jgi:hypothetical protein
MYLQVWYEDFHDRTNNTHRHETWMDAYLGPSSEGPTAGGPGGASKYKLPVRIDQALPSDHLASAVLSWSAVVSARIGGDMDYDATWTGMASTGAFLSALQIRPIMDVLWTQAVQPDNTEHLASRGNIEHELVIAVLTAGPVGFGDSLPHEGFLGTNVTRLQLASREDGVILKPAHTALRLDSAPGRVSGRMKTNEIWAAPGLPSVFKNTAGGAHKPSPDPATDRRANSFAKLIADDGSPEDAARWWYTLLATDVGSQTAGSCPALSPKGEGQVLLRPCAGEVAHLQLASDGTLRADDGSTACAKVSTADKKTITMATGPGCTKFVMGSDLSLTTSSGHAGVGSSDRNGGLCLTQHKTQDALTVEACTSTLSGQIWTTTDAPTGQYIERGSNRPLLITRTDESLHLDFESGIYWNTANCTLSADGNICVGGHFTGGSVGKQFPSCVWNASVDLPTIEVTSKSDGCHGCCSAIWDKVGYTAGVKSLQAASDGTMCAIPCGAGPPVVGQMIRPSALFPVPPPGLSFVARTFGANCQNGTLASRCLQPMSATTPLNVFTPPCPKEKNGQESDGCRSWKVMGLAPVLAGGWVLVGEENKYVALSPQRIVAAAAASSAVADSGGEASDALHESELQADGKGLSFGVVGASGETVHITVLVPASSTDSTLSDLEKAMAGSIIVVTFKLPASGRVVVKCTAGKCAAT